MIETPQPTTTLSLSLTDAAAHKLQELTREETNPEIGLRVYVYSGGCSGYRYGMMLEDAPTPDDNVLVEKGIRVNAVAPGPIWTPLNPRGGAPADKVAHFGESTPMKRPGEPNEVAPAFLFLACDDSSYMSGQVLHPNGGTIVNG